LKTYQKHQETPDDFYQDIIRESLTAIKLNTFYDNFDAHRFNYDGVDRSKEWMAHERVVYFDWFYKNVLDLSNAYSVLNDKKSKSLYLHIIAFRLASHFSVRIPVEFLDADSISEYQRIVKSTESGLNLTGPFGKLKHFDFVYNGDRFIVDCLNLASYLQRKQYFYERDGVSVKPEAGDYLIDGGAYLGDSAAVFSNAVGANGKVYACDPVKEHLDILQYNIDQFPLKNVTAIPYGLANSDVDAEPITLNGYAPGFNPRNSIVPLRSIDSLVKSGEIEKIDFIKLDVEGYEMDVLLGASQSIQRFQPKLAISLYHKLNDIFELITYIHNTYPFYNLHIGHYTIHNEETVLYCAPQKPTD
jgi:FkbM family methyltransferase